MYKRLYFYVGEKGYRDAIEKMRELNLYVFDASGNLDVSIDFENIRNENLNWYAALKPPNDVRRDRRDGKRFTSATYDVLHWRRGYLYKDHIIRNDLEQTLPRFKKPNPTELDLIKFEDAKALRKVWNALHRWMKAEWVDFRSDSRYYNFEAMELMERGYTNISHDPEARIKERTIYVGD